jgi:hypothetical protein
MAKINAFVVKYATHPEPAPSEMGRFFVSSEADAQGVVDLILQRHPQATASFSQEDVDADTVIKSLEQLDAEIPTGDG